MTGNHVFGTFGRDFPTSDGRRIMITAFHAPTLVGLGGGNRLEERFAALAAEKGVDLAKEEERAMPSGETIEANWRLAAARSLDEIGKVLDAVGACWGPYQTFRQAVAEDLTFPRKIRCSRKSTNPNWPLLGRRLFHRLLRYPPRPGRPRTDPR